MYSHEESYLVDKWKWLEDKAICKESFIGSMGWLVS